MKLYAFEEIDQRLKLMPLCARRALDAAGVKVGLASWQRLAAALRVELAELGSQSEVDTERVSALLKTELGELPSAESFPEPAADEIPKSVVETLGSEGIELGVWSALAPLDRYALAKVASRGKANRVMAASREILGSGEKLSHLDERGNVRMVDVAPKAPSARNASAESKVSMGERAFQALAGGNAPKGEVLATARLAGIMAAKRTSELIPLCHPLSLTRCEVSLTLRPEACEVHILTTVEAMDRTGVEMEALTAASVAALTVYDMLKGIDRAMTLGPTVLVSKSGGKSGDYRR